MATTTNTIEVKIAAGRVMAFSANGKAVLDIISGPLGAGYTSLRLNTQIGEKTLGPYSVEAVIRIRPNAGVTVTYNDKLQQVGVFAEVDPVTGIADGILTTRAARQFASVPLIVTGGDQVNDVQTATFVNGTGTVQWFRQDPITLVITDIAGQTGTTYTRALADVDKIVAAYATSWKPTAAGRITRPGLPTAPQNVVATAGDKQATITWNAPASTNGGALLNPAYLLTRLPGGQQFTTNALTFTDTGLANGTAYTYYVQAINSAGPSPQAASNSITPGDVATAPAFTASPTTSAAIIGAPVVYASGTTSGSPSPEITTELMAMGRPLPIGTVLSEVQRSNIDIVTGNIAVRQTASNASGAATRMSTPSLRAIPDTTKDPRWTQHPYFRGLPQVGRPVYLAGLTPAGTATLVSNHKFCISDTPVVEGLVDAAAFAAATATTGTTSGLNTQASATATYPVGEVGKYAYAIVSMSNGLGTIYFRTKSWPVLPAGVATNTYRFAAAGGGKVADRIYTNGTGVTMNVFGFIDVVVGSVQHGALKVLLANLAMPDTNPSNGSLPAVDTPLGSGSDYTFLSANLCVPGAAAANCPSVLFAGAQGTIVNNTYDIASDVMLPAAFGKTAHNAGDRLIFKYEIAVAPGGKLPYVSGGDNVLGAQTYLYNPLNTTISFKNSGTASAYSGTQPAALGDGIPFDIIGLQVAGDAPVDFCIGDSIAFNPQGRSYWAAAHYLCDGYGSPVIANSNGGRVGATHALFNNHGYLQSKIKYANRIFIEVGTNSVSAANVGNSNAIIALDNTTLGLIASNVAPTVAGLTTTTVVRMKLLMAFGSTNADSSNYSAATAETQSPVPSYRAGGDLETYFYPYLESQVPAKYARILDVRPALRLSDDPTHVDYYKAQPNTFAFEASLVVHPTIQGGIQAGMYLRELLAA